jgi:hypothetical protein
MGAITLRPKGVANLKAEARRISGDSAIKAAVEDVLKGIGEATEIIRRLPEDELGFIRNYDVDSDGNEKTVFLKKTQVFIRFTATEVRARTREVAKHPAAAWRLSASIAAARDLWETRFSEYKTDVIWGRP